MTFTQDLHPYQSMTAVVARVITLKANVSVALRDWLQLLMRLGLDREIRY